MIKLARGADGKRQSQYSKGNQKIVSIIQSVLGGELVVRKLKRHKTNGRTKLNFNYIMFFSI